MALRGVWIGASTLSAERRFPRIVGETRGIEDTGPLGFGRRLLKRHSDCKNTTFRDGEAAKESNARDEGTDGS